MTTGLGYLHILLVLSGVVTTQGLGRVNVKNGMFYSLEDGRTLMFRGINSVIKGFPWYDEKLLDPVRQQQLQDWGFNSVRLGMMWSGLEPLEGQVNETYGDIIKETVNGLADHGIYSYLDMHQDVLTGVDGYWGIPEWMGDKLEKPEHPYPWPLKDTSGYTTWACGYFTQEISNAFHQLYTNQRGLADYFANFWREVAQRFKDNTAVLGYELMNEPWTGDIYEDTSLLLPGNAGHDLLAPFFNRASDAIRSLDNETMIFWEPVTYAYFVNLNPNPIVEAVVDAYLKTHNMSLFFPIIQQVCGELEEQFVSSHQFKRAVETLVHQISQVRQDRRGGFSPERKRPSVLGPGFTAPPGGPDFLDRTVLSWHYYCWGIVSNTNDDFDPVVRAICDDFLGPMVFNTVDARAEELGGSATFLTEFGTCNANATLVNSTGLIECHFVLDLADLHLQSWSLWDTASGYSFWDGQGNPNLDTVKVFSRPYPPATAGRPLSISFDHESRLFEYSFQPDLSIEAPTEIFVPPLIYTQGFEVAVTAGSSWQMSPDDQSKILVTVEEEIEVITVIITPRDLIDCFQ